MTISPNDQRACSEECGRPSMFASTLSMFAGKQPKPWGRPGPQTVRGGPEVCVGVLHHALPRGTRCLHVHAERHSPQKSEGTRSRSTPEEFTNTPAVVGRVRGIEVLTTLCGLNTHMGSSLLFRVLSRAPVPPNHALQRTRPSRRGCNRTPSWAGSLSLGR